MARKLCLILGIAFLLVGICGFLKPGFARTHTAGLQNVAYIVAGLVSVGFGFFANGDQAVVFSYIIGALFAILGTAGFLLGTPDGRIVDLGVIMLGTVDHLVHVVSGALYLVAAFLTESKFAKEHEHEYARSRHRPRHP